MTRITQLSPTKVKTAERQWARLLSSTGQPFFHKPRTGTSVGSDGGGGAGCRGLPFMPSSERVPAAPRELLGQPPSWPSAESSRLALGSDLALGPRLDRRDPKPEDEGAARVPGGES